jgi:hypothetical protein
MNDSAQVKVEHVDGVGRCISNRQQQQQQVPSMIDWLIYEKWVQRSSGLLPLEAVPRQQHRNKLLCDIAAQA